MKRFFTLIELIVVIVVLGILATIVIPQISTWQKEAKDARLVADLRNTQTAVDMYHSKNGRYPSTMEKVFVNKPIDWEETVPSYLRKKPVLDKDQAFYIDPDGTVVMNKGRQADFLKWLRESPFVVTNPSDVVYEGSNPPRGAVFHNYNLNTNKFETYDNRTVVKTFTTAMVADALIETYQATGDETFLNRAEATGDFLSSMTQEKTLYGQNVTVVSPETKLQGGVWTVGDGEFYLQDMAVTAHVLLELGQLTGNIEYIEKGKALLDSLIVFQNFVKGSAEYPELNGALPFFLVNQGANVTVGWSKFPLDIATFVYDAGQSGYTITKEVKYKKFKDDYFAFVERALKDMNGLSPDGYPYEYIFTEDIGKVYGVNSDQINNNKTSPNEPFTTDQFFYLSLGLMKQGSGYGRQLFEKAKTLSENHMFWGQYDPDGKRNSTNYETFNTAVYLEMAKHYRDDETEKIEQTMLKHMLVNEGNTITNSSWAWSPGEYIIEDLVSAYVPKSLVYQPSLQTYNRK